MPASCRRITATDISKVLEFMEAYYRMEKIDFNREKSRRAIRELLSHSTLGQLQLIEMDGVPIGYFCLAYGYTLENHGRDCFLDEIYIVPAFQDKGIGTAIMKFIISYLRKKRFKALHLIVDNDNIKAFKYYIKNGFAKRDASFMTNGLMES
jgi:ribosomal protein S18 acetylase RimI-like enzyme